MSVFPATTWRSVDELLATLTLMGVQPTQVDRHPLSLRVRYRAGFITAQVNRQGMLSDQAFKTIIETIRDEAML